MSNVEKEFLDRVLCHYFVIRDSSFVINSCV
jgi:hypothetical protein